MNQTDCLSIKLLFFTFLRQNREPAKDHLTTAIYTCLPSLCIDRVSQFSHQGKLPDIDVKNKLDGQAICIKITLDCRLTRKTTLTGLTYLKTFCVRVIVIQSPLVNYKCLFLIRYSGGSLTTGLSMMIGSTDQMRCNFYVFWFLLGFLVLLIWNSDPFCQIEKLMPSVGNIYSFLIMSIRVSEVIIDVLMFFTFWLTGKVAQMVFAVKVRATNAFRLPHRKQ